MEVLTSCKLLFVQRQESTQALLLRWSRLCHGKLEALIKLREFSITKAMSPDEVHSLKTSLLLDPVTESIAEEGEAYNCDWILDVECSSQTAETVVSEILARPFLAGESIQLRESYYLSGEFTEDEVMDLAKQVFSSFSLRKLAKVQNFCDIHVSDEELELLSQNRGLSMELAEMQAIRSYFQRDGLAQERAVVGLPAIPTDFELELVAQAWNVDSKDLILNAKISYQDKEQDLEIDSLYETYIKPVQADSAFLAFTKTSYLSFHVKSSVLEVHREAMASGMGARPIASSFLLAEEDLKAFSCAANQSGVPMVNGAFQHEHAQSLCGCVGLLPLEVCDASSQLKEVRPGDLLIQVNAERGEEPYSQKQLGDFLLEARDRGLYRSIYSNGSALSTMADLSGGCEFHLAKPEILKEGMILAVPPSAWEALQVLAAFYDVDILDQGRFTESGLFHVCCGDKTLAFLPLVFLEDGLPKMELEATWTPPKILRFHIAEQEDYTEDLLQLLGRRKISSKESLIRQFDYEAQGGTVVKPLLGVHQDGVSDAAMILPIDLQPESMAGLVLANGFCPGYSFYDPFHMAMNAVDQAFRNVVAVGGDPSRVSLVPSFFWGDPELVGQLVRIYQGLHQAAKAFKMPLLSSSWNNSAGMAPSLFISALGRVEHIGQAVTMDFKDSGDSIYLIGETKNEFAASEYASMKGKGGGGVPRVNAERARDLYLDLHNAMKLGLVQSCHDLAAGGLAVAAVESALAGDCGLDLDLSRLAESSGLESWQLLFSETASRFLVTISQKDLVAFELCLIHHSVFEIGEVKKEPRFHIQGLVDIEMCRLKEAWQKE
jgi:selenophosphate synthetase-related protein